MVSELNKNRLNKFYYNTRLELLAFEQGFFNKKMNIS